VQAQWYHQAFAEHVVEGLVVSHLHQLAEHHVPLLEEEKTVSSARSGSASARVATNFSIASLLRPVSAKWLPAECELDAGLPWLGGLLAFLVLAFPGGL
jgi:hypothetical protein